MIDFELAVAKETLRLEKHYLAVLNAAGLRPSSDRISFLAEADRARLDADLPYLTLDEATALIVEQELKRFRVEKKR